MFPALAGGLLTTEPQGGPPIPYVSGGRNRGPEMKKGLPKFTKPVTTSEPILEAESLT